MNKRIVVTGGSGYIGSAMIQKLRDNDYSILNFSRSNDLNLFDVDVIKFALANHKPGIILHIAGAKKAPFDVNIEGTENLLKVSKELGIKRFIFISTSHVYYPDNDYAFSKIEAEKLCLKYYPDCLILRVNSVFGNGKYPFTVSKFMLVKSEYKRNFIHIDKLTYEILRVIESNQKGIVDIKSERTISFNEFAREHKLIQIPILNNAITRRDDE